MASRRLIGNYGFQDGRGLYTAYRLKTRNLFLSSLVSYFSAISPKGRGGSILRTDTTRQASPATPPMEEVRADLFPCQSHPLLPPRNWKYDSAKPLQD